MEVIAAYVAFSLVVALALLYNVHIPVLDKVEKYNPEALVVSSKSNRIIALITLTLGAALFSPILMFPALSKGSQERYSDALYSSLLD